MSNTQTNIVVLDGYTLNPGDLNWNKFKALGRTSVYEHTPERLLLERARPADILLVNKAPLNAETLRRLPRLKCICVTATGYNNVDVEAAKTQGVVVCNVVGYAALSVAQHVFALLLEMTNQVARHDQSVRSGEWSKQPHFTYSLSTMAELAGKNMGIYGLGRIGRQVARIALAFGMRVIANHKHPERDKMEGVRFVDLDTLFRESDVLSLHAPLTPENAGLINVENLNKMKKSAYLINTGRGGLINESALEQALKANWIAGAGLDVLVQEPPPNNHPFFQLSNCLITPHRAWASRESRQRLLDATAANAAAFLNGKPTNAVNL